MGQVIAQICCSPIQQDTRVIFWKHFNFDLLFVSPLCPGWLVSRFQNSPNCKE